MNANRKILIAILMIAGCLHVRAAEERIFQAITAANGLADNSAQTIKCTKTGRMTITTIGHINFYDGARFALIDTDQDDIYTLPNYQGHYHLYYDNIHHLWLKGSHNVVCVNLTTEKAIPGIDSLFVSLGMKEKVLDMFVDGTGNVWMMGNGYIRSNVSDRHFPVLKDLNLQDLEVYDNRQLLLFYEDGSLYCYDLASGRLLYNNRPYGDEDAKLYYRSGVFTMYEEGFFQIRNGEKGAVLLYYDLKNKEWRTIMRSEYHLNNMAIFENVLYIASEWGYFTYNLLSEEIQHHKALTLTGGRKLETDINTIEFDRQGGMWIGTEKRGLLYARPVNSPIKALTWDNPLALKYDAMMANMTGIREFNGRRANVMLIDSRQWTWVGTTAGLYLYRSPQDEPIVLTKQKGLLNNVIHSLVEDNDGNIWVGTSYGISCVLVENGTVGSIRSFNDYDNVPNETFINGKAMKLPDGTIVMQALDHVVTFNPADFDKIMLREPYVMVPKLTRLSVNGVNVEAGDTLNGVEVLEKAVTRTSVINLSWEQNTVTLTYSALNYARPLHTYYRVRIKELYGNEWREFDYFKTYGIVDRRGVLNLQLVGLKAGEYHVEVMASPVPGKWAGEPYVWTICVNEPWWRTTAVLLLLALIVVVALVFNAAVFYRNTKMREKRNTLEGEVIRRIGNFVNRVQPLLSKPLVPQFGVATDDSKDELAPAFIEIMKRVVPYVQKHGGRVIRLSELSQVSGQDMVGSHNLISENIYKSPRQLVLEMRLEEAHKLLHTTNKTVEQVAEECGFGSPNYLIAAFYHRYKMTPKAFRGKR